MLTLDKKTVTQFEAEGIERLKVFFYEAGCSGTKINMETEFEITEDLVCLSHPEWSEGSSELAWNNTQHMDSSAKSSEWHSYKFELYVPKTDKQYLENASITRVVVADHTGVAKTRYIFASDDVEDRCGCGTSFAFEKPAPKIDLEKLKQMRENFKKQQT